MDIEPQELIERLNEGKIYREAQARQALNHFFSVENPDSTAGNCAQTLRRPGKPYGGKCEGSEQQ